MMKQKSFTRVTLALDIKGRIGSGEFTGYHDMNILKHQVTLFDEVCVEPGSGIRIRCDAEGVPEDRGNICFKAAELLKQRYSVEKGCSIIIEKRIPVKGGLAGGSANAATVFQMLNTLWELNLSREELAQVSRPLGMDIPFYFYGGTLLDTEASGKIRRINTDLCFDFIIVIPGFGVSTADAYKGIDYGSIDRMRRDTIELEDALEQGDRERAIRLFHNDFESSVFKVYPGISYIKDQLIKFGCLNAVMTGSGSAVIGVAKDMDHAEWVKSRINESAVCVSSLENSS